MQSFNQLVGKTVSFYGVDNNCFCISVDSDKQRVAFEAIEDESDGWRSCLEEIKKVQIKGHIFFKQPIAMVKIEDATDFDGWKLVEYIGNDPYRQSSHVWLKIGTDYSDDYYPWFVFSYTPKV